MIDFILNDCQINTGSSPGMTLLDFIRYERHLFGTKIGCREGDCGACTILVGDLKEDELTYHSATSCLMPLGNAQGKHIVTIEGINFPGLNPVQQAICDEGATQCGFCTPGFVVSLTAFCMQNKSEDAIGFIDGNICRCTGYKSIQRAANFISDLMKEGNKNDSLQFAIDNKIIPGYFSTIKNRLNELPVKLNHDLNTGSGNANIFVAGGTDLYVQKHEEMVHADSHFISDDVLLKGIREKGGRCIIGASSTVTDLVESSLIRKLFPDFLKYSKLISSTPIRNMATLGGNFVNASPIGDLTVFFLALDAKIILRDGNNFRELPLRKFYKGYKMLDKLPGEIITEIIFNIPDKNTFFNFEKVSKRTNLDIASVNSAINVSVEGKNILLAEISAGGVGPVPLFLNKSSGFLEGKVLSEDTIEKACVIAGGEISPISDARGSATYKRFLMQQLIKAHFITLFSFIRPEKFESAYEEY